MVEAIDAETLHARLAAGADFQIVDVRPEGAFERGHVPGAVNLPIHRFTEAVDSIEWRSRIVLTCPHGESSLQAARLLEAYEGVDAEATIYNLSDGLSNWPDELETESEDAAPPF